MSKLRDRDKQDPQKFKFTVENHEWDASISVDSEDKPILRLFEDNQPFENLVEASS